MCLYGRRNQKLKDRSFFAYFIGHVIFDAIVSSGNVVGQIAARLKAVAPFSNKTVETCLKNSSDHATWFIKASLRQ